MDVIKAIRKRLYCAFFFIPCSGLHHQHNHQGIRPILLTNTRIYNRILIPNEFLIIQQIFIEYLYVPGPILPTGNTAVSKSAKSLSLWNVHSTILLTFKVLGKWRRNIMISSRRECLHGGSRLSPSNVHEKSNAPALDVVGRSKKGKNRVDNNVPKRGTVQKQRLPSCRINFMMFGARNVCA